MCFGQPGQNTWVMEVLACPDAVFDSTIVRTGGMVVAYSEAAQREGDSRMKQYLLPAAAVLGLVSANANAGPNAVVVPGTYTPIASTLTPSPAGSTGLGPLGLFGGITYAVIGPLTFTAPATGNLVATVAGCCAGAPATIGDVFQVFLDGVSLGFTSGVPLGGPTPSSGTFEAPITAGVTYTFDINDQILSYAGTATPDPYGGGLVPANFGPSALTVTLAELVPEPASFGLLASALLGLGLLRRRRISG